MYVSVIIPVGANTAHLTDQVDALARQVTTLEFEVILVDNSVEPRVLAGPDSRFRTVHASERLTPGYARNAGAKAANGDVLLFCDADDVVSDAWLESMALATRRADLVGGPVDERRLDAGPRASWASAYVKLPRDLDAMPWFIGANLGIRATAHAALDGWEEEWHASEEIDLCWRAQMAGLTLADVPEALVYYRPRVGPGAAFKQGWTWGYAAPGLLHRFPRGVVRRPPLARALRDWLVLGSFAPLALVSHGFRRDWARLLGLRAGRLVGTVHWRRVLL